jgi:intracellular sulfur oxidation DsrE/DsrF family protein
MKYFLFFLIASTGLYSAWGQKSKTSTGPVFKDFGQVYTLEHVDLLLDTDKTYKVIFDIYTDEKKSDVMNPLVNTVARFMNMHAQNGLAVDQMDIVVVLHGAATKDALSGKPFKRKFKNRNPNEELIEALHEKGVQIYVCGQSMMSQGFESKDISESVKISLSALTALVKFQSEGYQLINFN